MVLELAQQNNISQPSIFTLLTLWEWHPSVLLGCGLLIYGYLVVIKFKWRGRAWLFGTGVGLLFLALESPLHTLADTYLFSAHMIQHILLIQIIPPLLLLSLPEKPLRRFLSWKPAGGLASFLGIPFVAWIIGIGTMWIWHLPALYNATLLDHNVHIAQHLTFLVAATILWWPVLSPVAERRSSNLFTMLYLFSAAIASSLLGVILTFAPEVLYPGYLSPVDSFGVLGLLRNDIGISPQLDQQLGGLIMWALGGVSYLAGVFIVLGRWYNETNREIRLQLEQSEREAALKG